MASLDSDRSSDDPLEDCEDALEYRFADRELLETALTHASVARTRLASNERMEFLGDAIMGAVVCEMLFQQFPESSEGELTRIKSAVVSRSTCARLTAELGISEYLYVGKGLSSRHTIPSSVRAGLLESIVAAIYLDGGFDAATEFVQRLMDPEIEKVAEPAQGKNFKSQLQQAAQKRYGDTPVYRLLDEKGPDHSKCFKIAAIVGDRTFQAAWGINKKQAEQRAAENALCEIKGEPAPYIGD